MKLGPVSPILIYLSFESEPGSGDLEWADETFRFFNLLFGVFMLEPGSLTAYLSLELTSLHLKVPIILFFLS